MDRISPSARSANMKALRSKGMRPEMAVRRLVHRMGYRYRLHAKDLLGKPDLVFRSRRKVVFVHGCFWHQHCDESCQVTHRPRTNLEYWLPKLARNVERDEENRACLEEQGWRVLTIWECEVNEPELIQDRIRTFLAEK